MTVERLAVTDRATWLAARHQDMTASVAGTLFGVHPYTTLYRVWAEKTGRVAAQVENTSMRRGTMLEPICGELLQHVCPTWQVEYPIGAYWRDGAIRLGATPDAFATRPDIDGQGVVQVKTIAEDVFRGWLDPDTSDVILPDWIAVQTLVEAHLTASTWAAVAIVRLPRGIDELVEGLTHSGCDDVPGILRALAFAWLHLGKAEVHVVEVPIHARLIKRIRQATVDFWAVTDAGESPPPDWSRDGDAVLNVFRDSEDQAALLADPAAFERLAARYAAARDEAKRAGDELTLLKPQIIAMLGNAERAETGRWAASAKTVHRKAYEVRASSSRPLNIRDKAATEKDMAA
jgi:predicted phage-related endonuclease